jgi:hypothetical protein
MALNVKYLADADKLLEAGDYSQASEKYWGAVAEIIKAVAATRGWRHSTHRELLNAVTHLAEEVNDREIARLFKLAESLHANFYENFMPAQVVSENAANVKALISRIRQQVER